MPHWESFHDWMAFGCLDVNAGLTRSFTIGYRLTDDGADSWTARFNRFKDKKGAAIRGGMSLMEAAVPLLVGGLRLDRSKTVFLPALSSAETVASKDGVLSLMTSACARAAGVNFVRDAIGKKAHSPLHNTYDAGKRREILDGADYKSGVIQGDNIFIFDDFITRGDTLSHIAQAIRRANPGVVSVYGVGLGKTERRAYNRDQLGIEISNDHVPAKWATSWDEAEAS